MVTRGANSVRGSGLIVAMAVLAMLSIMATTFIALVRLDTRISNNYSEDVRCELLAKGMLDYFKAILRDDLDRTWNKYENRDMGVGFVSRVYASDYRDDPEIRIPGFYKSEVGYKGVPAGTPHARPEWGIPVSNDFWYCAPWTTWGDFGSLYTDAYYMVTQQSFAWNDHYGQAHGMIGRFYSPSDRRDYDVWVGFANNMFTSDGVVVSVRHPGARQSIDDDADGTANPVYVYGSYTPYWYENNCDLNLYYDKPSLVMFTGNTYYFPGSSVTGESRLSSGLFWRWGVKLGISHSAYANVNVHGNMDGSDSSFLNDMGGIGLVARKALEERLDKIDSSKNAHLGRIAWKGFAGEYEYQYSNGFPERYDEVGYHPSAASLERLFQRGDYPGGELSTQTAFPNLGLDRDEARNIIRSRWGGGTGIPGGGMQYRNVWRRDGATYVKFPSPENPDPRDSYFGANEVMEHDHPVNHPFTSDLIDALVRAAMDEGKSFEEAIEQAKDDWRDLRPYVTMWSSDTILRGKIWPAEGPPYTNSEGDWKHIDILKRVNLNMIGASGPEGIPGEDDRLKQSWAAKRDHERERLYYMLLAALKFSGVPWEPEQKVCQLIAALADMVDRDQDETYYVAPDGSGNYALGTEKFAAINEVVVFSGKDADKTSYELTRFRIELCNPAENIPWIPDKDEAFDISEYRLKVGNYFYRLGDLNQYGYASLDVPIGKVKKIGADGMYAYPDDPTPDKKSWSRLVHVGWEEGWPAELTRADLQAGLRVEIWKPLKGAAVNAPLVAYRVEMIDGVKCICVDRTPIIRFIPTDLKAGDGPGAWYSGSTRRTSNTYVGTYRRWDPLNTQIFKPNTTPPERDGRCNVLWVPGATLAWTTLGKPNTGYTVLTGTRSPAGQYKRNLERNFKIVDGDLPSIGWLGELIMRNAAQDGPLSMVHDAAGQDPTASIGAGRLDTHAKFDLFRPFKPAKKYDPDTSNLSEHNPINLHVLDIFTVWDPSNDGVDNDGDGAVDDDDTGRQNGDKGGPEVRVFGRMDINLIGRAAMGMVWPDGGYLRSPSHSLSDYPLTFYVNGRQGVRSRPWIGPYGPVETIGDLLRADEITRIPGGWLAGDWWVPGPGVMYESGPLGNWHGNNPATDDDDGDGMAGERDERDLIFTWICNYFTTRANVFECDLSVQTSGPPMYPSYDGEQRKLPFRSYKVNGRTIRVTKQLLAILDRSTCLRINPDGSCDFSGPVEARMVRFTDDMRTW